MSMTLSESDVTELLEKGDLTVNRDISWRIKNGQRHYEFRVPVLNQFRGGVLNLELVGTKNTQLERYSFVLMLDNRRIRGLCPFERHVNRHPNRESIGAPHKHKWSDHCQDSLAYVPEDITDVRDIARTFEEFLKECSITHIGNFKPPPTTQPELPIQDI